MNFSVKIPRHPRQRGRVCRQPFTSSLSKFNIGYYIEKSNQMQAVFSNTNKSCSSNTSSSSNQEATDIMMTAPGRAGAVSSPGLLSGFISGFIQGYAEGPRCLPSILVRDDKVAAVETHIDRLVFNRCLP